MLHFFRLPVAGVRRSSEGQQRLDLSSSIAAAEARLTACAPSSETQQADHGAQAPGLSPAAAAAQQLSENGDAGSDSTADPGRLAAGQLAADKQQLVPAEPITESTPRCSSFRPRQVET